MSLTNDAGGPSRLADTGFPFLAVGAEGLVVVALGWSVLAVRRQAARWEP